jgi:hypothetical protein
MQGGETPSKNSFFIPYKSNSPDYNFENNLGQTDNKSLQIT